MARCRLTIEYDGAVLFRLAAAGERALDPAGDRRGDSPRSTAQRPACWRRRTHRRGRARDRAGRACRPRREWAGWRLREAINAHLVEQGIAVVEAAPVAANFDARRQRGQPPLPLSSHQPARAADLRARARVAREDAARRRGDARGRAVTDRPPRFLDLSRCAMPGEFAPAHARLFRRRARRARRSTSTSARARSCIGRSARWSVPWSRSDAANGARRTCAPRWRPRTEAAAGRSRRRRALSVEGGIRRGLRRRGHAAGAK